MASLVINDDVFLRIQREHLDVEVERNERQPWWRGRGTRRVTRARRLTVSSRSLDELVTLESFIAAADKALRDAGLTGLTSIGYAELILASPGDAATLLDRAEATRARELPPRAVTWVIDTHFRLNYPPKDQATPSDQTSAASTSTGASSADSSGGPSTSPSPTSAA